MTKQLNQDDKELLATWERYCRSIHHPPTTLFDENTEERIVVNELLAAQARVTRKETLEEVIKLIESIPLGGLFGALVIEKLQSLINKKD